MNQTKRSLTLIFATLVSLPIAAMEIDYQNISPSTASATSQNVELLTEYWQELKLNPTIKIFRENLIVLCNNNKKYENEKLSFESFDYRSSALELESSGIISLGLLLQQEVNNLEAKDTDENAIPKELMKKIKNFNATYEQNRQDELAAVREAIRAQNKK